MRRLLPLLLIPLCFGCVPDRHEVGQIQGYAPVYLPAATARVVSSGPPTATVQGGKIYAYKDFFFQVEQGKGIHIMAGTTPQLGGKIGFISIPGCSEIAIKGDYLYTNNVNDLVVFNIASVATPTLVSRQANAFPQVDQQYPPFTNVYFECADAAKGIVVDWELKTLQNPRCRR